MSSFGFADRSNYRLNAEIEQFINVWDGTAIGQDVKNMYTNDSDYESICERINIDYSDYSDE